MPGFGERFIYKQIKLSDFKLNYPTKLVNCFLYVFSGDVCAP